MLYTLNMEIYIEDVLFENFVIDYFVLMLTAKISAIKVKRTRLLIVSIIGALISLFTPLLKVSEIFLLLLKISCGILLTNLCFFKEQKKFYAFLIFIFLTFTFGGACYIIAKYIKNPITFILPIVVIAFAIKRVIFHLKAVFKRENFKYVTIVENNGIKSEFTAFLDTGNTLTYNSQPLPIFNISSILKIYPEFKIEDLLKKKLPFKVVDTIKIKSVNSLSTLKIINIEKFLILKSNEKHIFNNINVGVTFSSLGKNERIDCLLPFEMFK